MDGPEGDDLPPDSVAFTKRANTALAVAALLKFQARQREDGSFDVSRWGHTEHLPDCAAFEAWLARATGVQL